MVSVVFDCTGPSCKKQWMFVYGEKNPPADVSTVFKKCMKYRMTKSEKNFVSEPVTGLSVKDKLIQVVTLPELCIRKECVRKLYLF